MNNLFRLLKIALLSAIGILIMSCNSETKKTEGSSLQGRSDSTNSNDSSFYLPLKYDFYQGKDGKYYEKKLAYIDITKKNVPFFDSRIPILFGDTLKMAELKSIIDIVSYKVIDSTDYSVDTNHVYYFYNMSDGGHRSIVYNADPFTFRRLSGFSWGKDKNNVYYQSQMLEGLDVQSIEVLKPKNDPGAQVEYIKDNKSVFHYCTRVQGADAKTFVLINDSVADAKDKNRKYLRGSPVTK